MPTEVIWIALAGISLTPFCFNFLSHMMVNVSKWQGARNKSYHVCAMKGKLFLPGKQVFNKDILFVPHHPGQLLRRTVVQEEETFLSVAQKSMWRRCRNEVIAGGNIPKMV